jgi:hypothetical protein
MEILLMSGQSKNSNPELKGFDRVLDAFLIFVGIRPTHFEFIADMPLEQCVALLKNQEHKREFLHSFGQSHATGVDLDQIDESTYKFRLIRKQPEGLPIILTGDVKRLSDASTLIRGVAQSQQLLLQLAIISVMCSALFLGTVFIFETHYPSNIFWGGLELAFFVLIIALTIVMTALDRRWFINYLREAIRQPRDNKSI